MDISPVSLRQRAIESPAEVWRGGVGEQVGAGGVDEIGQGGPAHQIRGGLDGVNASGFAYESEVELAMSEYR